MEQNPYKHRDGAYRFK